MYETTALLEGDGHGHSAPATALAPEAAGAHAGHSEAAGGHAAHAAGMTPL